VSGNLAEMAAGDRLDLSVQFESKLTERFKMDPLWIEELFLIVAPQADLPDPIPIRQIARLDMVVPSSRNGTRLVLEEALRTIGTQARVVAELDSVAALKSAVAEGIGCTVFPWSAVHTDVAARKLKAIRIKGKGFHRTTSLCVSRTLAPTPAVECVARIVRELAKNNVENINSRGMRLP
jgi:DNA-binding transcriptional LysR family regulator